MQLHTPKAHRIRSALHALRRIEHQHIWLAIIILAILLLMAFPARGTIIVDQTPVSGGGVSRWSQLWQDPGPLGNDLDSDAVCWTDFRLNHATTISHLEWWGQGACELGFQLEFWRQDPGTVAYQPRSVFYYGGDHTVQPEPPGFIRVTPDDYSITPGPGGISHYSLDLSTPVTLAANDTANPRWFVGVIGLTHQAYFTWNWSQGLGGSNRTYQFVRGSTGVGPRYMFRSLGEGRGLLIADASSIANAQWTGDIDSAWTKVGNWLGGSPDGVDHTALFPQVTATRSNVVVDAAGRTLGSITFDSTQSYTIGGAGTLTLDVSTGPAAITVRAGTHVISAPVALADSTMVAIEQTADTLTMSGAIIADGVTVTKSGQGALRVVNVRAQELDIAAGTVSILLNGTDAGVSRVHSLAIAGGVVPSATLDLADNDLIVTAGDQATLAQQIAHARAGGAWNATGTTSSAAAAAVPNNQTLGILSGTEYQAIYGAAALFDGYVVADADVLVKFTYNGDTDLNGRIDFDDYARIDTGFNNHRTGWINGDIDYNGAVNFDDYALIDLAFNTQTGTLRQTPEPGTAMTLLVALLLGWRNLLRRS